MEATPSALPDLPWDVVERVAVTRCRAGGMRGWCKEWRGVCRAFADVSFFEKHVRGGVPLAVVPSEKYPTVQSAVSRALASPPESIAEASATRARLESRARASSVEDGTSECEITDSTFLDHKDGENSDLPVVIIKPGVYSENVRITRSCVLLGWGGQGDVIIEGTGWEAALVFAGLGVDAHSGCMNNDKKNINVDTGSRSVAVNLTLKCRNRMQAYAVVVVSGRPEFDTCRFHGGCLVLGATTKPRLINSEVNNSRGAGVKVTDHGCVVTDTCVIKHNSTYGLLLERSSWCVMRDTRITENEVHGVLMTPDSPGVELVGDGNVIEDGVRVLEKGNETETHLHGESVDQKWLEANDLGWEDGVGVTSETGEDGIGYDG